MNSKDIGDFIRDNRSYLDKLLGKSEKTIFNLFRKMVLSAFSLPSIQEAIKNGTMFEWSQDKTGVIDRLIRDYAQRSGRVVLMATLGAYQKGEDTTRIAVSKAYGSDPERVAQAQLLNTEAIQARRKVAMSAHQYINAKRDGMTISQRVWNLATYTKKEIEICVQNSIIQGHSAQEASREVRMYLNRPDTIFRRVRDKETGEFRWSKSAQEYHSGRGVYKSAYKNAMRLTRTEVNNAFRAGEWQSYQDNDLVTGYEIRLSNNHTTIDPKTRQPEPFYDICDELAGEYPKEFKWQGWHPQCRCAMIPILLSDQELGKLLAQRNKAIKNGEDPNEVHPDNEIQKMPPQFEAWFDDNLKRLENGNNLPHWITDNTKPKSPNIGNVNSRTDDPENILDKFQDTFL